METKYAQSQMELEEMNTMLSRKVEEVEIWKQKI